MVTVRAMRLIMNMRVRTVTAGLAAAFPVTTVLAAAPMLPIAVVILMIFMAGMSLDWHRALGDVGAGYTFGKTEIFRAAAALNGVGRAMIGAAGAGDLRAIFCHKISFSIGNIKYLGAL